MDQITVKSVFSEEANIEAEKIMRSAANFMSVNTSNTRTSKIEAMQTLYHITRWIKPSEVKLQG